MKRNVWIFLVTLSIASLFFTYRYFQKAVPFVNLNITMDKDLACSKSRELAQKYSWNIQDYDMAVKFTHDQYVQAFAELEGGGKSAFISMIENDYYQPYEWVVRFYKPATIHEIKIGYTPTGKPYDVLIKIPEAQEGPALSRKDAERIALSGAGDWDIDMSLYDFVEHNSTVQPNGRVDHSFVYQRRDATLEAGLYQLKLQVCGDVFTQVNHTVKIPDEFNRRYAQMFANNNLLAGISAKIAILLYLFIIAFFLILFFSRDRAYLFIRQHVYIIVVFGVIMLGASLNQWPFIWCSYPTHVSAWLFGFNALMSIVQSSALFSLFVVALCVVVDAADRYVFGRHIQFLKIWSPGAGGSKELFEMTVLGYLFAIIMLGYEIAYIMWAQSMGWWGPLNSLIEPNILSSYIPFLSPIAQAFRAGFWEEFATRGLPLAGILFLTRNSRYKGWWFIAIMCLQAIIFGALHANYPFLPSYYRVVELFLPSLAWGMLYYRFGLFPGIVAHFVYDAILMCIPIWVSSLLIQKIAAVGCILIPFWVLLYYYVKQNKTLVHAAPSVYNDATSYQEPLADANLFQRDFGKSITRMGSVILMIFGAIGLICFYYSKSWNFPIHQVTMTPRQAQLLVDPANWTDEFVSVVDTNIHDSWTITSQLSIPNEATGNVFIWQLYGADTYKNNYLNFVSESTSSQGLLPDRGPLKGYGSLWKAEGYVLPAYYEVSWKKFTGTVEERAEEIKFWVSSYQQRLIGMSHTFPESLAGADLSEEDAQKIARKHIAYFYGVHASDLEIVLVESKKHAQRRDYKIIYKDNVGYTLDQGLGYIVVKLAGDKLSEVRRMVHVPEDWQLAHKSKLMKEQLLQLFLYMLLIAWCLSALFLGIIRHGLSSKLSTYAALLTSALIVLSILNLANSWMLLWDTFTTSEPLLHQVVSRISSYLVSSFASYFLLALFCVLMVWQGAKSPHKKSLLTIIALMVTGAGIAGIELLCNRFKIVLEPQAYYYKSLNAVYPTFFLFVSYFVQSVLITSAVVMALCTLARIMGRRYHETWVVLLFMVAGVVMSDIASLENIPLWIGSGFFIGVIWFFLYRGVFAYDLEAVWFVVLGTILGKLLPSMVYGSYPDIRAQVIISFVMFLLCLIGFYRKI